jgi:endonuclease/exonuclease/phosphatase family metal-dependent hydrolase
VVAVRYRLCLSLICGLCLFRLTSYGEKVRIASVNVENYLVQDRWIDGRWRKQYPKPEREKRALRSIINQVNPDVLLIQEMGKLPFLNELWRDLNSTQGTEFSYSYWMEGSYEDEARHLALLSKIPFKSVTEHKDIEFNYFGEGKKPSRGLMEIHFESGLKKWTLFNLHLKSKWTERKDDPEANIRREKEARAIRDLIRKKYPPAPEPYYLVGGDFNDHKNSPAIRRFTQVNDTELTQMLPCQDQNRHFWTHYYAKQDSYARLDYLLASPKMYSIYQEDSAKIYDGYHCLMASDHRMIYADFDL